MCVCIALCMLVAALPISGYAQKKPVLTEDQRIRLEQTYINATREKMLQNYDEAIKLFTECLKLDENNAAVYFQLADLNYLKRQYADAEKFALRATQLDAGNLWYHKMLADIYEAKRDFAKAARVFEYLSKHETETSHLLKAAYYYSGVKNYKKAIAVLNAVEHKNGITEEVILQKEQLYLATNKVNKAAAELQKLIKAFPNQTRYKGMLAELYLANKKEEKALVLLFDILKSEPENGYAAFSLCDYYRSKNDAESFYTYFKIGVASKDVSVKNKLTMLVPFVTSALYPDQKKRNEEVLAIFRQAHPDEPTAYMLAADLKLQEQDFAAAREQYKLAISKEPSTANAWQQLLYCNSELEDYQSMITDCESAIVYFPNESLYYFYGAIAATRLIKYAKAIEFASSGVRVTDDEEMLAQLYSTWGDAAHHLKKYSDCDSVYALALKLKPDNTYALNNFAYFLSLRSEKLEQAEKMSKRSLELDSTNASYMDTYGWILYKQGNYTGAFQWIEKALQKAESSADVLEHMGDVYYKLQQTDNAVLYWKKAVEAGSTSEFIQKKINERKLYE
ncbi:MAG: tetratricopeptide repeat protein [Bacteroidota bacterium]